MDPREQDSKKTLNILREVLDFGGNVNMRSYDNLKEENKVLRSAVSQLIKHISDPTIKIKFGYDVLDYYPGKEYSWMNADSV